MAKLFLLLFVWGPAMIGFSLGWVVVHPDDWTGPAVVFPLGVLVTALSYRSGLRRYPTASEEVKPYFVIGMTSGALVGVCLFGMLVSGVLS